MTDLILQHYQAENQQLRRELARAMDLYPKMYEEDPTLPHVEKMESSNIRDLVVGASIKMVKRNPVMRELQISVQSGDDILGYATAFDPSVMHMGEPVRYVEHLMRDMNQRLVRDFYQRNL